MSFKALDSATKLYEKVKALDAEIIQIDKAALTIANNKTESKVKITVKDLTEHEKEDEKVKFDEDGSIVRANPSMLQSGGHVGWYITLRQDGEVKEAPKNEIHIEQTLNPKAMLYLLGNLLQEKIKERDDLVGKIEALGIKTT